MRPALVALALAAVPAAAHGQDPVPVPLAPGSAAGAPTHVRAGARADRALAAGDTVRIVSAAGHYAGTIFRITPDTVVVRAPGRMDAVPRGEVTRLERFEGKSSRGRAIMIGGGAGLAGGSVLGAIAGRVVGRNHCEPEDASCTPGGHDRTIQGALLAEGAILGTLVGAMLGPTFRREHWDRAEGAFPLEASPAPGGGVAAGVTLRF